MLILLILALLQGLALAGDCLKFTAPLIPKAKILDICSNIVPDLTLPSPLTGLENVPAISVCNVTVLLTHPGDDDHVVVNVWLPHNNSWNGRYVATSGGGLAVGYTHNMLSLVLVGFASSSTDGGLTMDNTVNPQSGTWISWSNGTLNKPLLLNLAHRSIHEMSIIAKNIIAQYYGTHAVRSYFTGCSQGGRQGYASAAHHPEDFDGILTRISSKPAPFIQPRSLGKLRTVKTDLRLSPRNTLALRNENGWYALPPSAGWLRGMLPVNTSNIFDLSLDDFYDLFDVSVKEGGPLFGLETLNFTDFHAGGGKLLSWVGLSDELINPLNLLHFYDSVQEQFDNSSAVDDFFRLFTAPGVGHCKGGSGPQLLNAMTVLVDWVEHGIPPETLPAMSSYPQAREGMRSLCRYPRKPVYLGGDVHAGSSFFCSE
ncbi:tannase and feruloyl esterase-domain-containing protein [Aspergillus germanicus]